MKRNERWLSVEEISGHLGVPKETVYRWLERRQIPAHRMGKLWKFQRWEVDDWVRKGSATKIHHSPEKEARG
jgi:excisionase family DNA binding protein